MNFGGRRSCAASPALFFTWHSTSFTHRLLSLLPVFSSTLLLYRFRYLFDPKYNSISQSHHLRFPSNTLIYRRRSRSHIITSFPTLASPPSIIRPTLASPSPSDPFNPLNSILL